MFHTDKQLEAIEMADKQWYQRTVERITALQISAKVYHMVKMKISRMRPEQWRECGLLIARAMQDYEYFANYISEKRCRFVFLKRIMGMEVRLNKDLAYILMADMEGETAAVAVLYPPGGRRPSGRKYIKAGILKAFLQSGFRDAAAWCVMDSKGSIPCHRLKGKTWYLSILAVEPKYQGLGIGSMFIQKCIIPFVRKCGGENLCLFTNSERNRKFYLKNGFREFDYREFRYNGKSMGSWSFQINDIQKNG